MIVWKSNLIFCLQKAETLKSQAGTWSFFVYRVDVMQLSGHNTVQLEFCVEKLEGFLCLSFLHFKALRSWKSWHWELLYSLFRQRIGNTRLLYHVSPLQSRYVLKLAEFEYTRLAGKRSLNTLKEFKYISGDFTCVNGSVIQRHFSEKTFF